MTPHARQTLLKTAKRFGFSGTLLIGALSWGFKTYDATNASSTEFHAYRDSVAAQRKVDSLILNFQFQYLSRNQLRTDSAVRKVCAAVNAGC